MRFRSKKVCQSTVIFGETSASWRWPECHRLERLKRKLSQSGPSAFEADIDELSYDPLRLPLMRYQPKLIRDLLVRQSKGLKQTASQFISHGKHRYQRHAHSEPNNALHEPTDV